MYFALNSPAAVIGTTVDSAVQTISSWGFVLTPEMLAETAENIGESSILSRTGGAPTLAIGIASIFAQLFDNNRDAVIQSIAEEIERVQSMLKDIEFEKMSDD